jgi:hypothetical protein
MDRSSPGVREDEKMERRTVGVTGIREFGVGWWSCGVLDFGTAVDELDVDEPGMSDGGGRNSNFCHSWFLSSRLPTAMSHTAHPA